MPASFPFSILVFNTPSSDPGKIERQVTHRLPLAPSSNTGMKKKRIRNMTGKKKRQNRKETPSSSPSFMHLKRQRKLPTTFPLLHLQKYDTPRRQISPFTPSSILRSFPPKETPRDRDRDKDRSLTSTICHSPRSLPEYMNEEEEKQD